MSQPNIALIHFPIPPTIGHNREFLKNQLIENQLISKIKFPIPVFIPDREIQ